MQYRTIHNDFDMMYDDWMTEESIELRKTYVARDLIECINMKYPDKGDDNTNEQFNRFYDKALTVHQKLIMMIFAEYHFHKVKLEFEGTQNMSVPVLYGLGNTKILFYLESMILFARNALDVVAYIYSDLIFNTRMDSFNQFSKKVVKFDDIRLEKLKQYFINSAEDGLSVYRLLCGNEKGRALRDIIIHQANVRLEYHEYKENSEKEHLFLILKDMEPIDIDLFVEKFIDEVEEIVTVTTLCCKEFLEN